MTDNAVQYQLERPRLKQSHCRGGENKDKAQKNCTHFTRDEPSQQAYGHLKSRARHLFSLWRWITHLDQGFTELLVLPGDRFDAAVIRTFLKFLRRCYPVESGSFSLTLIANHLAQSRQCSPTLVHRSPNQENCGKIEQSPRIPFQIERRPNSQPGEEGSDKKDYGFSHRPETYAYVLPLLAMFFDCHQQPGSAQQTA